jgi:hypothetical protein
MHRSALDRSRLGRLGDLECRVESIIHIILINIQPKEQTEEVDEPV